MSLSGYDEWKLASPSDYVPDNEDYEYEAWCDDHDLDPGSDEAEELWYTAADGYNEEYSDAERYYDGNQNYFDDRRKGVI